MTTPLRHTADPRGRRTIGVGPFLCALAWPATASAQHDPGAAAAINELQHTYRTTPICERIGIQVRQASSSATALARVARAAMVLRMEVAPTGFGERPIVALDLGALQVVATDGELVAVHSRDATRFFRAPVGGPVSSRSLGEALQAIPVPPLDLAAADFASAPCTEFWPYARDITWTLLDPDPRVPTRKTVRGRFPGGNVALTISSGRLRSLLIERNEPKTTLLFTCTPTGPCDPGRSVIDTSRRTPVESIADLKPRAGVLRVGAAVPALPITWPAGGPWKVADLLEAPPEAIIAGIPPADHAVLVFTRPVADDGRIPSLPRLDVSRLAGLLKQMRSASFQPRRAGPLGMQANDLMARFGFARVLVLDTPTPEELLVQMRSAVADWPDRLLWTTSGASTLGILAPGADAAVVILDALNILRAVWVIDPNASAEQVADQLQSALFELAPGERKAAPSQDEPGAP